jgi:hypothetical protein
LCGKEIPQVTPGSRRQNHTISPYAAGVFVRRANPPDAATSIATRVNVP